MPRVLHRMRGQIPFQFYRESISRMQTCRSVRQLAQAPKMTSLSSLSNRESRFDDLPYLQSLRGRSSGPQHSLSLLGCDEAKRAGSVNQKGRSTILNKGRGECEQVCSCLSVVYMFARIYNSVYHMWCILCYVILYF